MTKKPTEKKLVVAQALSDVPTIYYEPYCETIIYLDDLFFDNAKDVTNSEPKDFP